MENGGSIAIASKARDPIVPAPRSTTTTVGPALVAPTECSSSVYGHFSQAQCWTPYTWVSFVSTDRSLLIPSQCSAALVKKQE